LRLELTGLAGDDLGSSIQMSKISAVLARAGSHGEQVRSFPIGERWDLPDYIEL
jgi:hypothetical protein